LQRKKLPNHWHIDQNPVSRPEAVVQGASWRVTVLTANLLRIEYSPDEIFEDRATQFALDRNFPPCRFSAEDSPDELAITTETLLLRYDKKPFSKIGLSVRLLGKEGVFYPLWRYGDKRESLGGTLRTLDTVDGPAPLEPGILSKSGIAAVDDSRTLALDSGGWAAPRREGNTDLYIFAYGRDYRRCLRDFYRLTGPTPLLPRYALGNWWSRYYRYSEQSYKELIERFESEKIPFSVSVIDMDWHCTNIDPALGSGWTGFTWNRELFPDPKGFLAWLHQKSLMITMNLHPADGIRAHEEAYSRIAKRMGVDTTRRKPVEFDAANPDFIQAYFEEVLHPLEDEGVDFWWVDWQQGDTTGIPGLDPLWVLNHFHYLDSARRSKRALAFSRYAGLGSHRYPVGFSGDSVISWASLEFQPYFTATASNAGYGWWSHDIGGHMHGVRDDELAVRWVQFGVFSPINRLHSTSNPFISKEPWHFNPIARNVMSEFLRLRHRLVPYLYAMNRRARCEGEPLVQPLYYAEPNNETAYRVPNEYYFGSELLCCPLTAPMNREAQAANFKAWLPSGIWIDFFNGRIYSGGRLLELWRGLDAMPVLAKAGGIVPLAGAEPFTNSVENPQTLELHVFAGADGSFRLWEDSGDTAEDRDENWALTLCALDWNKGLFVVSPASGNLAAIPAVRSWNLRFSGFAETALKLSVGGRQGSAEPVYDKNLNRISLSVPQVPVNAEIRVEFEKAELAQNDTLKTLFDFLDNAWIEYDTKSAVFNIVKDSDAPASALAALQALNLPASIYSCICEILSADVN
jgi:alpha-glucosidase (family GH31 glycosyl hydrolase)